MLALTETDASGAVLRLARYEKKGKYNGIPSLDRLPFVNFTALCNYRWHSTGTFRLA